MFETNNFFFISFLFFPSKIWLLWKEEKNKKENNYILDSTKCSAKEKGTIRIHIICEMKTDDCTRDEALKLAQNINFTVRIHCSKISYYFFLLSFV